MPELSVRQSLVSSHSHVQPYEMHVYSDGGESPMLAGKFCPLLNIVCSALAAWLAELPLIHSPSCKDVQLGQTDDADIELGIAEDLLSSREKAFSRNWSRDPLRFFFIPNRVNVCDLLSEKFHVVAQSLVVYTHEPPESRPTWYKFFLSLPSAQLDP